MDRLYPVSGLDELMQMKLSGSFIVVAMITVPLIPPPLDFSAVFAHSHILKYSHMHYWCHLPFLSERSICTRGPIHDYLIL
jgi:hypothetical protein